MPPQRHQPAAQCIFCTYRLSTRSTRASPSPSPSPSIPRPHNSLRAFSTTARPRQHARPQDRQGSSIRKYDYRAQGVPDWKPKQSLIRRTEARGDDASQDRTRKAYNEYKRTRFKRVILERLDAIEPRLRDSPIFQGMDGPAIDRALGQFRWYVRENIGDDLLRKTAGKGHGLVDKERERDESALQKKLFEAMKDRGQNGLDAELQYSLYNHVLGKNFTKEDISNQRALANLKYPTEWYPGPRALHRTIHAHIGPTNSGKTYHALKRLEAAQAGLYAGPLRLLAHEVYTRLNAKGTLTALVTGEEQRLPKGWEDADKKVVAATVEMTSLSSEYDVAVIDEIQMLGSLDRGFAWTQALLGLNAREIHVCGEVRALPIIRELAAACGDELVVHSYDRLTRLQMDHGSLNGSFKSLRKGDCIVTFSVVNIHALRTEVERKTGKKAAVVYGSLPPETRAQQARLFNDPDNDYDYLIASDAVGMGLNLSIKRIIFETVHKFHSGKPQTLSISEIRQIAGRAGRYKTSHQAIEADTQEQATTRVATAAGNDETTTSDHIALDSSVEPASDSTARLDANKPISVTSSGEPESASDIPTSAQAQDELTTRAAFDEHTIGLVTTIDAADFGIVASALATEPPPLTFASIQPPPGIVQRFASYFPPGTPFSYILLRLTELSDTTSRYRIYHKNDAMVMADMIHGIEGLSIEDRMIFINAPASIREKSSKQGKLLKELATCIGSQRGGDVLSLKNLALELLDSPTVGSKPRLKELEELHKGLVLYLWLSFRFPGVFTQRPLANYTKELVESEIEETLRLMTFKPGAVRREQMRRRSVVEDEIMRIVREQEMKRDEKAGEVAVGESGFESAAAEPIASESGEGESMPVDDEGAYPEEEEGEAVEASAQDENASSNAKGTSGSANDDAKNASLKEASSFSEWRDKAQQSLHQEKTESVAVEGDEPVSRDAQEENEGKQKASG